MVRTAREIAQVAERQSFRQRARQSRRRDFPRLRAAGGHAADRAQASTDERIALGEREIYVAYGESGMGQSRLRIPAAEAGTARNMNTVAKLAELAREMA